MYKSEGNIGRDNLINSMMLACRWIIDKAQVKNEQLKQENNSLNYPHKNWRGSIRGEYSTATKVWDFFCPIWHTGQAVKALVAAYTVVGDEELLSSAKMAADFLMNEQIKEKSDDDYGLILGYEDSCEFVNTSAILECVDGLFDIGQCTGEGKYTEAALDAISWVCKKAYLKGQGLFLDKYHTGRKKYIDNETVQKNTTRIGRPLADDGVLLRASRLSGDDGFRQIFFEVCDRLLKEEEPEGNWMRFVPCNYHIGRIHPRHAFWWGKPMIMAFEESGDQKYLDCAIRAANWYVKAQRADGGLFRGTYADFCTDSFGHSTSGIACAAIMWSELIKLTGDVKYQEPLEKALSFCMSVQFTDPSDMNLDGAILEKILPPDGTDRSPYYIRDLGTIFYIQAIVSYFDLLS